MKKNRFFMMAFAAILIVGVVSCGKDENTSGNGENNGGDNPGGGGDTIAEWVDLGLPSGILWAMCNLGANSPEEYGNYYAWGETQSKEVYNWSTYCHCTVDGEGSLQTLTKYNTSSNYGTPDNLTTLEAIDDAATATLSNGAHTPTKEEWVELINNTTVEWMTLNGVNGCKFTASNGNTLFLPAAGTYYGTGVVSAGNGGYYLSSSLSDQEPDNAWGYYFDSGIRNINNTARRYGGFSVRAVRQN